MNCHINPKYAGLVISGGSKLSRVAFYDRDENKDHAFMAYSVKEDRWKCFAKDGRTWNLPYGVSSRDIATVEWLESVGSELLPDLWMVRNEEPSPFCFERK